MDRVDECTAQNIAEQAASSAAGRRKGYAAASLISEQVMQGTTLRHLGTALLVLMGFDALPLGAQVAPTPSKQATHSFHAKVDEAARAFAKEPAFEGIAPMKRTAASIRWASFTQKA
jgi:hypothetical protein